MTDRLNHSRLQSLVSRIRPNGSLIRMWPLTGGITNTMTVIEIEHPSGDTERLVVRQFGRRATCNVPDSAGIEFRVLRVLEKAEIPAPRPVYLDVTHTISNDPLLVVSFLDGSPDLGEIDVRVICAQLAHFLTRLHAISSETDDLSFMPVLNERLAPMLEDTESASVSSTLTAIRAALSAHWPPPLARPPVMLHGDLWPGNILWKEGQVAAAVDWEDAVTGDPLFDVASVRLELLWLFGEGAMQDFTAHYIAATTIDPAGLPFWDLCAALDPAMHLSGWNKEPAAERHMHAELARFVDRAIWAIAGDQDIAGETNRTRDTYVSSTGEP